MDQIRSWLFIGKLSDTLNKGYFDSRHIQAMLQFGEPVKYPDIDSLFLFVHDDLPLKVERLQQGLAYVRTHKLANRRVLIACGAGINRSSAFTTAILKEEEDLSLFEAFKEVKRRHPESMPTIPVWESLCAYYKEDIPYIDILRLNFN